MPIQKKDLLEAAGPPASLAFAAWIFIGLLQRRYVAAVDEVRDLESLGRH